MKGAKNTVLLAARSIYQKGGYEHQIRIAP